jgi:CheY-like chemotaxis protein
VLAADDHPTNRLVVETILGLVSAEVTSVEDGAQALQAVEAAGPSSYDVILMDLQMPVMDGLEATRRIRALEAAAGAPRTPLLVVTANTMTEHLEAAMAAGADAHMAKPVTPDGLLGAIGRTMALVAATARGAAPSPAGQIQV